jgi:DNA-binding NtrC family response regulator
LTLRKNAVEKELVTRILIADDQRDVLEALRILLKSEGYQTEAVTSLAGVFNALEKKDYALLLMDLNYTRDTTSGQEGLSAIPKIQAIDSSLPIVVMTAWATIELAVDAMKRGARDFVTKPWDNQRLLAIVRTQIELAAALRRERKLEAENQLLRGSTPDLIAESPAMQPVMKLISRVAPSDANVLITGENGTGKSLIARAIHALSPRALHAMITVNMGGLSETLFESELFGHVKGAFTDAKADRAGRFELADESTLFMDEIANIPLAQQAKLLRVIETGDFERVGSSKTLHANVRIISATNANIENEVATGRFRQDLLFRLNTIQIPLPSLRDRREDIMLLAASFLSQHAERYRKQISGFDETARERLLQHRFPGNIRELDHIVERAVLMTQDRQIRAADLGLTTGSAESRDLEDMSLEEVEAFLIKKALARNDGNARKAAEALGLSRSAFYRRLQQYGL